MLTWKCDIFDIDGVRYRDITCIHKVTGKAWYYRHNEAQDVLLYKKEFYSVIKQLTEAMYAED